MNVPELKDRLRAEGFDPGVYGIDGDLASCEGLVLERDGGMWKILHFDRGVRDELARSGDQAAACQDKYELLCRHFSPQLDRPSDAP